MPEMASARVLVIDDDQAIRRSVTMYLEDLGYATLEAVDGVEGLEQFRGERPDAVLLDLRMPRLDGLEVLGTIARESPGTPVVIVSGTGHLRDAVTALRLGAWGYILKPIEDMGALEHTLHKVLERARLLRENRRYQEHLEEQVKDRTARLERANAALVGEIQARKRAQAELEARNTELERFVYTVSHDLRSPLVTISGFLGVLMEDVQKGNTRGVEDDLEHIRNAVDKMQRLLTDLLELARIGRIAHPPEPVAFTALTREAAALVAGRLAQRSVAVDIAPDMPVVKVDRARLLEVMQNLLDNAAKFMGGQINPRIEVGVRQDGQDDVFYVKDNGQGILPAYHQRVFGLFERLDSSQDGTGVGLAIVKRIIEAHGGRIWVESEGAGRGSTFCFTIGKPGEARDHG